MSRFGYFTIDNWSLAATSFANAGQGRATALEIPIKLDDGSYEPFLITSYQFGACIEFAGVVECWTTKWSFHNNFRYDAVPVAPEVWFGDDLDLGGILIQGRLEFHMDAGSPVVDLEYGQIICQRFTETGHGDLRVVTRGNTAKTEFRGGPKNSETVYGSIGPSGLLVGAMNIVNEIIAIKARLDALEAP